MLVCKFLYFIVLLEFCSCRNINTRNRQKTEVEYYTKPRQSFTIKLMIHFDKALTRKVSSEYGRKTKRKLKSLAKEIVSDVEKIFAHPSLNQKIKFELVDARFLTNNSKILATDENASEYLKNYCTWQSEKKKTWRYYSVLLTGLDLFYPDKKGNKVRRNTGRGYMSGMCSEKNSCTVIEWHSKSMAFLLAHEIGHSLGISHDGPPFNKCKVRGHVMSSNYNAKANAKSWSSCSQRTLKKYLTSDKAWCLRPDYVNNLTIS